MKLPLGKVPVDVLEKNVLGFHGYLSSDLLVGPKVGVDVAVINLDGKYLIISSDPVTGVQEDIGMYAVNVSANDVATSGARPKFLDSVVLLPEGSDESIVRDISEQIDIASKKLHITIIGGHTEVTPKLKQIIVITTAFAITNQYVTAENAEEDDIILMTKTAGIEGTSILARTFRNRLKALDRESLQKAEDMINQISVVEDAAILFSTGQVHAMHDPTEGGIIGGVYEMALASGLGFKLQENRIKVAEETTSLCNILKVDPTKLAGSGCLLAAVKPDGIDSVIKELEKHSLQGTVIGKFCGKKKEIVKINGSVEKVQPIITDELWRLLKR